MFHLSGVLTDGADSCTVLLTTMLPDLHRVYEAAAEHKASLSKYCMHMLSDYITHAAVVLLLQSMVGTGMQQSTIQLFPLRGLQTGWLAVHMMHVEPRSIMKCTNRLPSATV